MPPYALSHGFNQSTVSVDLMREDKVSCHWLFETHSITQLPPYDGMMHLDFMRIPLYKAMKPIISARYLIMAVAEHMHSAGRRSRSR